ncbi:hypothetical protein B0H11DRAFT_1923640 [Mycena galericulata]|nr:hypothetical protein B0H11DRAFT_1923640 [Mycena galericulata]
MTSHRLRFAILTSTSNLRAAFSLGINRRNFDQAPFHVPGSRFSSALSLISSKGSQMRPHFLADMSKIFSKKCSRHSPLCTFRELEVGVLTSNFSEKSSERLKEITKKICNAETRIARKHCFWLLARWSPSPLRHPPKIQKDLAGQELKLPISNAIGTVTFVRTMRKPYHYRASRTDQI